MHYKEMNIHPNGDDEGAVIGEVVHKHGGVVEEKRILGILYYRASFQTPSVADGAKAELEKLTAVSHVDWIV